jgi:hypothetical protein
VYFFSNNTGRIRSPHLNFHSIDAGRAGGWKGVAPSKTNSLEKYSGEARKITTPTTTNTNTNNN